jgi:hypothetical protein
MYIYYRQCHRSLKPAAVFPIEVELGIDVDISQRYSQNAGGEEEKEYSDTISAEDQKAVADTLPPVDDLLLDLGLTDTELPPPPVPAAGNGPQQ